MYMYCNREIISSEQLKLVVEIMRTTHYSFFLHMFVFIAQERRHTEIQPDGMENALQITLITVTALHCSDARLPHRLLEQLLVGAIIDSLLE